MPVWRESTPHSVTVAGKNLIGVAIARQNCTVQEKHAYAKIKANEVCLKRNKQNSQVTIFPCQFAFSAFQQSEKVTRLFVALIVTLDFRHAPMA